MILLLASMLGPAWAATASPTPAVGEPRPDAYYLYSLAQQALLGRDYRAALDYLTRAAESDPSLVLLLDLARLRYNLGDLDGATTLGAHLAGSDDRAGRAAAHRLLAEVAIAKVRDSQDAEENLSRAVTHYEAALRDEPGHPGTLESLAELLYHTGRAAAAADLLQGEARRGPLDPSLALLLGKAAARAGRPKDAEAVLRDLVHRDPTNLEAADALATLLEQDGRLAAAIAVYAAALPDEGPGRAYGRSRIGEIRMQDGKPDEAIRDLEEALAIDPEDTRVRLLLAQAHDAAGHVDLALAGYARVVAAEPANLEARLHHARLLQEEGDQNAALQGFQEIIAQAAGRGALSDREAAVLVLANIQTGSLEMGRRHYDQAVAAFTRALEAANDPDADLFLLLARANLEDGRIEAAGVALSAGERRHPGDLELAAFRGELLIAAGDRNQAQSLYETILKQRGDSAETYARIGESLLRRKVYDLADRILREGTARHPEDDALAFAHGAVLERMGRLRDAERLLDHAIKLNPKNAMALNYLGYMLADRGLRLRDSVELVQRALAMDPRNAAYLDSLGWAQFKLGQFGPAEESLRQAKRYDGADPTIREHLGDLLMRTGRPGEAVQEWEAAIERGHEDPEKIRTKITGARQASRAVP